MRISSVWRSFLVCSALFLSAQHVFASALDELGAADQQNVESGGRAEISTMRSGPWPELKVYQLVNFSPKDGAAVFADYQKHNKLFNDIISSDAHFQPGSNTVTVDYLMKVMKGLGKEHYTWQINFVPYDNNQSFKFEWHQVVAERTQVNEGSVRFEPHAGGTLIAYTAYSEPKKIFGFDPNWQWVKDGVRQSILDSVTSVIQRAQSVITGDHTLFNAELFVLDGALNGKGLTPVQ